MKKAVFLDRDGTLNIDYGYVHEINHFRFIDGSIEALKNKNMGYLLVLVTNQSGIARGYFTEQQFLQLTEWMDWSLADRGVDLDGIYYCPHHPEAKITEFKQDCDCRKPKSGMLLQGIKELNIDPSRSIMIGDKTEDLLAGKGAKIGTTILVRTGKEVTSEGEKEADYVLDSIADLPRLISAQKI
ncbi:LOW QUALITY PROTEIN: D,D-heptose 1,7-bisphosphate phosphatase [Aggregatibacter actinomycetemcomitans ANH9381]|nr:LOW QUALITY PROTEIN: D,D-heptose 1,7-bisphosphate phosphatase [Aggregatibacter actinomycetemcomitans ANH9381]